MNGSVDKEKSLLFGQPETCLQNAVFGFGVNASNEEQDDFLDDIEQFLSVSGEAPQPPSLAHDLMAQSTVDRRKHRTPMSLQQRHDRTLEKNRRAQKKYRDKQKNKYSAMELQLDSLTQKIQSLEIEKKELKERTELLERILRDKESSSSSPQNTSQEPIDQLADSEKIKQAEGSIYFSAFNKTVSSDMIRNMHVPEVEKYLMDIWEEIVQEMTVCLKEVEDDQTDPRKLQKLSDIVNQCGTFFMRMFTISPIKVQSYACEMKSNPHKYFKNVGQLEGFIREVVEKMELTEQQKAIVAFLWDRFQGVQKECMAQRKEIAAQLQNLESGCDTQWCFFEEFMKTHELLLRVRENWRQSYRNHCDFMSILDRQIFTPVQYAKCIVHAHPLCVDDFVFCKVIVQDLAKPPAKQKQQNQQQQPPQIQQQQQQQKQQQIPQQQQPQQQYFNSSKISQNSSQQCQQSIQNNYNNFLCINFGADQSASFVNDNQGNQNFKMHEKQNLKSCLDKSDDDSCNNNSSNISILQNISQQNVQATYQNNDTLAFTNNISYNYCNDMNFNSNNTNNVNQNTVDIQNEFFTGQPQKSEENFSNFSNQCVQKQFALGGQDSFDIDNLLVSQGSFDLNEITEENQDQQLQQINQNLCNYNYDQNQNTNSQ